MRLIYRTDSCRHLFGIEKHQLANGYVLTGILTKEGLEMKISDHV